MFFLAQFKFEILKKYFMQKQNNKKLKNADKEELDVLDRFLRILWRKEVEYKINVWKIHILRKYLMKVGIGFLIILFIFHSLSDFVVKKRVLKNNFRRAQKVN